MVKIVRNVGGIPGLDLALDCFSEDIERRLFESSILFNLSPQMSSQIDGRNGMPTIPLMWDEDVWKLTNLIGDLFPGKHVPPDYCLGLSYPVGAGFQGHFDSRYRWGECIVGVSLGQESVMYYTQERGAAPDEWKGETGVEVTAKVQKSGKHCVEVHLPRRSIYIMQGPARLDWKHGIRQQTRQRLTTLPAPPSWNLWNLRRSLTFRCTKAYSDAYLQQQLELKPNDKNLLARWKEQKKFRVQGDYDGARLLSNEELATLNAQAQVTLNMIMQSPLRNLRFGDFYGVSSSGIHLGSESHGTYVGSEDDAQLQAAIRASLVEQPETPNGGSAANPISLDDDDEGIAQNSSGIITLDDNRNKRSGDTSAQTVSDMKRKAFDHEEDRQSKLQHLRNARLRHFDHLEGIGSGSIPDEEQSI